jgi:hypothetical protein
LVYDFVQTSFQGGSDAIAELSAAAGADGA